MAKKGEKREVSGESSGRSIFADLTDDPGKELASDSRFMVRLGKVMLVSAGALIGRKLSRPLGIDAAMGLLEKGLGALPTSVLVDMGAAYVQVPKILKPIVQNLGLPPEVRGAADELIDGVFRGIKEAQQIRRITVGDADKILQQGLFNLERALDNISTKPQTTFADVVAQLTEAEDHQLSLLLEAVEKDSKLLEQWAVIRDKPVPLHLLRRALEQHASAPAAAIRYIKQRMPVEVPRQVDEVVAGAFETTVKTAMQAATSTWTAFDRSADAVFGTKTEVEATLKRLQCPDPYK